MQRRIRFAGGSDGPEILPRSSQSGSRPSRNDKSGMIKSLLMVAALIATVYVLTRLTRNMEHTDIGSTGEGEGLEDFMLTHDHHDQHHNTHEFRTARERDHDHDHAHHLQQHNAHDTHAHQLHDSKMDADGSIVVQTSNKTATTPPVLAPAHTVTGDAAAQHAAADHAAAHTVTHGEAVAAAAAQQQQQQQQAVHPAVPATQPLVPAVQQAVPAVQQPAVPAVQTQVPAVQLQGPAVQQAVPAAQTQVPAAQPAQQQQPPHMELHSQQQPAQAAAQQPTPAAQNVVPTAQQPAHGGFEVLPEQAATQPAGSEQQAAPAIQPPVHADAVAVDEELPEPVEDVGAAAPAHQHHAHAARIDTHSPATGLYGLTAVDIDGRERHLSEFAGKVTMVVNVASQCGFTDENYKGLQEAYTKYHKFGFEVLAFPSNEFGNQEPGTNAEIKSFCTDRYHTTFPVFSKVQVNGAAAHPVYQYLKRELPVDQGGGGGVAAGKDIGWNFYKFLVGRDGKPVKLFHQQWKQTVVEHAVYELLVDPQYVLDSGMHHG